MIAVQRTNTILYWRQAPACQTSITATTNSQMVTVCAFFPAIFLPQKFIDLQRVNVGSGALTAAVTLRPSRSAHARPQAPLPGSSI